MKGKIKTIIGPVVDVEFEGGYIPAVYNALEVMMGNRCKHPGVPEWGRKKLVMEVAYNLGGNSVRAIAMDTTDGLARGMEVTDTGAPISVPVGGRRSDASSTCSETRSTERLRVKARTRFRSTAMLQNSPSRRQRLKFSKQVSKSSTSSARSSREEKSVSSEARESERLS